jgi:hypothetical protein
MTLVDGIELDVLAETGDVELAAHVGVAVRAAVDATGDTLAAMLGLGPSFSAELAAAIG